MIFPAPTEPFDIAHPALPGVVDGLTLLHISDLHVRRTLAPRGRYERILHALAHSPADLIMLTGDYMDEPGQEEAAIKTLQAMAEVWRPRLGVFGIFGNHDTPKLRKLLPQALPAVQFPGQSTLSHVDLNISGCILRVHALDWPEDHLRLQPLEQETKGFELILVHHPTALIGAVHAGIPLMLAGHTHNGQIRLHPRLAPHTSSDLPPHLAGGCLRLGQTLCCISRGLGDGVIENLRVNCARQMPLYTLRPSTMAFEPCSESRVMQVFSW